MLMFSYKPCGKAKDDIFGVAGGGGLRYLALVVQNMHGNNLQLGNIIKR